MTRAAAAVVVRLKDDNLFSFVELNGACGVRQENSVLVESATRSIKAESPRRQGLGSC